MNANQVTGLDFTAKELRIMVQSLGNCLATCQVHAGSCAMRATKP